MNATATPASATDHAFAMRGGTRADIAAVRALALEVWWAHYPGIISDEQIEYMLARGYADDALQRFVEADDAGLELAESGVALVGFGAWYRSSASELKIDKLYVRAEWQRHGVGRALIARIADIARAARCSALVLNVNKNNVRAIAAYRKHGFAVREAVVADIGNGFVMDDFVMARAVP